MAVTLLNPISRTITSKTGTIIEKAVRKTGIELANYSTNAYKGKLITYGENAPMKKLGVDQAFVRHYPDGDKFVNLYTGDKEIFCSKDFNKMKNFISSLRQLADAGIKLT